MCDHREWRVIESGEDSCPDCITFQVSAVSLADLARAVPAPPLYGTVYLQPHDYSEFKRGRMGESDT